MSAISYLEVKYGCIYGGYPNFFVVSEASLLIYEPKNRRIFVESFESTADIDLVYVTANTDENGHTLGREKYVFNLRTKRRREFDEEYKLTEDQIGEQFKKIGFTKKYIRNWWQNVNRKYRFHHIITFDGKRDVFLLERQGVEFRGKKIFDIQKTLTKKCNYLFSMNKLSVAIDYSCVDTDLKSSNLSYNLHPRASSQIKVGSAAWDASRMFMVHQELTQHGESFMKNTSDLIEKIQQAEAAK